MSTDKIHVAEFWMNTFELSAWKLRSTQSSLENLAFRTFKHSDPFQHSKMKTKSHKLVFKIIFMNWK